MWCVEQELELFLTKITQMHAIAATDTHTAPYAGNGKKKNNTHQVHNKDNISGIYLVISPLKQDIMNSVSIFLRLFFSFERQVLHREKEGYKERSSIFQFAPYMMVTARAEPV